LRKIGFILILAIVIQGCSAVRNRKGVSANISNESINENVLERTIKQNVTQNGFYIQKAEIEINTSEGKEKVLGSIKFERPEKYLVSIKSRTGIEALRIFISDDTILVNDRINKKLYCGSPEYLRRKYGLVYDLLPLIIGDYIPDKGKIVEKLDCRDGTVATGLLVKGIKINYLVDCKKAKLISATQENNLSKEEMKIQYDHFYRNDGLIFPEHIRIMNFVNNSSVDIKIVKFESQWKGSTEFIPGNKYEILELK
jgi:hypothetical protein